MKSRGLLGYNDDCFEEEKQVRKCVDYGTIIPISHAGQIVKIILNRILQ